MKNNMIASLMLLSMLTTGASVLAEETAPVATPATADVSAADPSPTGSSFFAPKTQEDVDKMAHVSDSEFSESAVGNE